jgi:uncharacterized SAM-binding protein YcdF (DUF218 family)
MIKSLIGLAVFVVLVVLGLNYFLQPDDLGKCPAIPDFVGNCHSVDAIVAISGGDTSARANEAIDLFRHSWGNLIIFSGAAADKSGPSNAVAMKNLAIKAGVDEDRIIIDESAESTKENAQNSAKILSGKNVKSIILVTSGYHQKRAYLEFGRYAKGVTIMNHPAQDDKDWSGLWWLTFQGWWLAVGEIIKIGFFYISGIWS